MFLSSNVSRLFSKIHLDLTLGEEAIDQDITLKGDYSVSLDPKIGKNSLEKCLSQLNVEFKKGERPRGLRSTLVNHLKKIHPINDFVASLEKEQVMNLLKITTNIRGR